MLRVAISGKDFPAVGAAPGRGVLGEVVFDVPAGERVCLFGPSGCGKSTTLNLIAGLDRSFTGRIDRDHGRLAYVFQEPRLLPWRTCLENVALPLGRGGAARAQRWLEAMGVGETANVYPQRISLGMARRVAMARAFAVEPTLLLLDEPFVSLDARMAERLRALLLRTAAAEGTAVVAVSHDPREAAMIGHRVLVMGGQPTTIERVVDVTLADAERFDDARLEPFVGAVARR